MEMSKNGDVYKLEDGNMTRKIGDYWSAEKNNL